MHYVLFLFSIKREKITSYHCHNFFVNIRYSWISRFSTDTVDSCGNGDGDKYTPVAEIGDGDRKYFGGRGGQ
jgi:hypothetical protein